MGDTILLLPALRALRRWAGSEGHLALVGTAPYVQLALGEGCASEVHDASLRLFSGLWQEVLAPETARFFARFDTVVSWGRSLNLDGLAGLDVRIFHDRALPAPGVHAVDHYLGLPERLGALADEPRTPELSHSRASLAAASRFLTQRGLDPSRLVALHPSSGSPDKNWPSSRFDGLRRLAENDGFQLLWIAGPADEEVLCALPGISNGVARGLELDVLAAVLAQTRAFIGNDSGITHLATAAGARVVALFGPTDPNQWAPRGESVRVTNFDTSPERVWGFARESMRAL